MFMPFQILGMWFRGLLSLALIGVGAFLLREWYLNRSVDVVETVPVATTPDAPRDDAETRETRVRTVEWQFGMNRETAYLLGGLALIGWSFGGGFLSTRLWLMTLKSGDDPKATKRGATQRLRLPDGSELHIEISGPEDGIPVILTHGWGLDSGDWHYARNELSGRYRVITWDLPGLGRSDRPADNDWALEKLARALDAVLSLARNRPAILVGHSIGGMITLTFCRLFPEALGSRVQGIALVHSTYTNPVKTTAWAPLYTALQKPVLEPLCHLMIWLAPLVWLMNWLSYFNGSAQRSTHRSSFAGNETREQLNFMAWYYVQSWPAVLARGQLAMCRYDATATLSTIPVPALIVAGDKDNTCKPEASVTMSKLIPNATLRTLSPARHCGHFEHHEQFAAAMHEFVAACVSRQTNPVAVPKMVVS